ncbi:MAG: hypothetical protein K8H88_03175 [Sandaracinaceae bacterium]|nr:hypothetical protein [Sandaracinaceae bacterium]
MLDQLKALIRLSEIDASARSIEDELLAIPKELEERRMAVKSLELLVAGQETKAAEATRLFAQQEEEIKTRNDALARSRAKGAKARTMREAEASERELEAIRRSIRDAETERDRLKGIVEQTRVVLEEPVKELGAQREALAAAEHTSEQRLAELRAERDRVVAGRGEFAAKIDKAIVRRYDRIRTKMHPAVVEAVNATCTGCRMALPPQFYIQIQAGKEIFQCPTCQRFLFHRETLD